MVAGKDICGKVRAVSGIQGVLKTSDSDLSWEIIVVDDNSPDGTQEIAEQLAKVYGDDKIVTIHIISY